jgi:hypothetical protein
MFCYLNTGRYTGGSSGSVGVSVSAFSCSSVAFACNTAHKSACERGGLPGVNPAASRTRSNLFILSVILVSPFIDFHRYRSAVIQQIELIPDATCSHRRGDRSRLAFV